jgi:hypothetical protein
LTSLLRFANIPQLFPRFVRSGVHMPRQRRAKKKTPRPKSKKTARKGRKAERQLEAEIGKLPGAPTPAK